MSFKDNMNKFKKGKPGFDKGGDMESNGDFPSKGGKSNFKKAAGKAKKKFGKGC